VPGFRKNFIKSLTRVFEVINVSSIIKFNNEL
jgi:hypothetical protein